MLYLVIGLIVFLGAHGFISLRGRRTTLIEQVGAVAYRVGFALVSTLGLVLIVWGFAQYRANDWVQIWIPPLWTRHLTMLLMWFAFVALACGRTPGSIRGWLHHPMLVGVTLWAAAHLLSNGDLGGMLLFGSFLVWAIYDRVAVTTRGDFGAPRAATFTRADAVAVVGGTVAYLAMILLHPLLIGVPVVAF